MCQLPCGARLEWKNSNETSLNARAGGANANARRSAIDATVMRSWLDAMAGTPYRLLYLRWRASGVPSDAPLASNFTRWRVTPVTNRGARRGVRRCCRGESPGSPSRVLAGLVIDDLGVRLALEAGSRTYAPGSAE